MTLEHTPVFRGEHMPGEIHPSRTDGPFYLDLRDVPLSDVPWDSVVEHLRDGGLLAYPTETVYGLGAVASSEGVGALAALKGVEPDRPFIALIPDAAAARELTWTSGARELASLFWPGALTLILPDPEASFPEGVRSSSGSVAVRVSPHPFVETLMVAWGAPLLSTSANRPGDPPATSGGAARAVGVRLGAGAELLVVDAGTLPPSSPSTIVDCTLPEPVVVREGSVPMSRLRCVLPGLESRHG